MTHGEKMFLAWVVGLFTSWGTAFFVMVMLHLFLETKN